MMAIRKCKECGTGVSTKAESCPKCGAVLKKKAGYLKGCCLVTLLIPFIAFMFLSILGSLLPETSTPSGGSSSTSNTSALIPSDLKYTIIKESTFHNYKRSLDVRLNQRVSEHVLRTIANQLKSQDPNRYDRTFIGYYLPGMRVNAGSWATSHFTPDLEVKILGTTIEEHERLDSVANEPVNDNILGRWRDNSVFPCIITLQEEDGKVFMLQVFKDGSKGKYEMMAIRVGNETRYRKKITKTSDYLVINSNGDLAHGDNEGVWATSKRIK